jgi:hypothetical protein
LKDTEKREHPIKTATLLHHKLSQFESKTRIVRCSENREKMALEQTSIARLHQRSCENNPFQIFIYNNKGMKAKSNQDENV